MSNDKWTTKDKPSGANAYDVILSAIEKGELNSGNRLRETELAERLGLSRTPVREALKQLQAEGLVEHRPHHGAVVAQLDYSAIVELYFLREVLEGAAARLAALHASPTEVELMQSMLETDRRLPESSPERARHNKAFHQQVCRASRNRFLIRALDNLRITLALGTTLGGRTGVRDNAIEGHAAIVNAIAARDPIAAEEAARSHVRGALKIRLSQQVG
jgi:DNA-binding GntR family transcriptional regulator